VNIGLRVLDQREDGYHNIHTIFQELAFHDTVTIYKTDDDYELSSNDENFPTDSSNTCSKAYVAVKVHYPDVAGIKIHVKKEIPQGSGLGGGSSNGATTLKGMNELYNLGLSNDELTELSLQVGADVPFFIHGGTQLGEGIGEQLTQLDIEFPQSILVIIPRMHISTKWAYSRLRKKLETGGKAPNFAGLIEGSEIPFQFFENDFEKIVFSTYPEIGLIKDQLLANKARFASLSGSGSAVFGLFDDDADARSAELLFSASNKTMLTRTLIR
jgi:4-diphosphocytidyl-2-C-methyl-D-erythritol kinase